jgi:CRP-like cAMP-binding protein
LDWVVECQKHGSDWCVDVLSLPLFAVHIHETKVHPFDLYGNATDEEIEQTILSRKMPPLQNSPVTAHLSDDAIQVIQNLLQWDPNKRLTAQQLLDNPWVQGETARTSKMADSDKKLSTYRAFKSKLAAKVFADMVALSEEGDEVNKRSSLLENAFHRLDPSNKGYVTPHDLQHIIQKSLPASDTAATVVGQDEQLSLSGFSDLLSDDMKDRYFPTGHMIYHEGDTGDNMFFLNSGSVQIFTKDGFSKIMSKPGDFFGEGALLSPNKIRSASIRCLTPVHVIEIDRAYFEKYMASDKELKLNLREKDKTRKRQRAKALLNLQQSMDRRNFRKGEHIFREGDVGDELYFLEKGQVDVSVLGNTVFEVDKGGLVGMHSVVFGRPRNTTATCISESCKFHVLRKTEFASFLKNHPSLKESIRDMCLRREFQKAVCLKTKRPFPRNEKELREAFDTVDHAHVGALKLRNIRALIQEFEPSFTEDDIQDILHSLDLDESGEVSWTEFKKIFFDRKPEDSIH